MRALLLKRMAALVAAAVGLSLAWSAERSSLERANRLHRDGRSAEAAQLYGARAIETASDAELRYNLGTALAAEESPDAELELARALPNGSREIRSLAQYNTGVLRLDRALEATESDSIRAHATVAVGANQMALRLEPDNPNAKWNLAMALRLLDSIDAVERTSGRELTDGAVEADVVTRSVNVPDAAEDEFAEDPPAEGEDEAVAVLGDESPLSPEEAAEILSKTHLDATEILGKLLALESRNRWGRQIGRSTRRW